VLGPIKLVSELLALVRPLTPFGLRFPVLLRGAASIPLLLLADFKKLVKLNVLNSNSLG
jgi:hypothetical protein